MTDEIMCGICGIMSNHYPVCESCANGKSLSDTVTNLRAEVKRQRERIEELERVVRDAGLWFAGVGMNSSQIVADIDAALKSKPREDT